MIELYFAHRRSIHNRDEILRSHACGCFACLAIYQPSEIWDWVDEDADTATCPRCQIDSVIGDASGFPIDREFLSRMEVRFFNLLARRR